MSKAESIRLLGTNGLYVMEADGHNYNFPIVHVFRDFEQLSAYLGEEFQAEYSHPDDFDEWQDEDNVTWTNLGDTPSLPLTDHRER